MAAVVTDLKIDEYCWEIFVREVRNAILGNALNKFGVGKLDRQGAPCE